MIKGMESMLILLVMNLLVVFSAYLLASRCFKLKNAIDSWVLVFLLYFTQIILTELMLGIEGRLFLLKLLILNSAILFSVWMITRKRQSNILGQENFLEIISADKSLLLAICVLSGFALAKISINLVNPPFGWDSLNYHFTFPVEWLKNGNLNMPITINDDPSPPYYPLNGNLFFFWLMLPLKNVFLADLGQLPFFVVSFFLTFSISRKMGVSKELSFFSSCLFVLIPNFFKQLQVAYVDIMVAALFMAALNFLLSLKEEFSLSNVSAFAISLGLIIGTKTIALPYSALLLFPFLYLVIKNKCKPYFILTFISLVIALGGFTYIRNFITTGNPLYPMDYKLFGKAIFKGVMDAASYGAHFEGKDHSLTKILFHEGLGAQTLIFVLPALFAALPATIIKKKNCKDLLFLYILALPVLLFLTWRFLIPLANIRYLYPLLGVGMVAAFY
ncbi:MAG: hypothetical protein NTU54_00745, partial [Candidatus Omnitrophica bacterium]|nr:hypothetical protein [Candidatus Omnitrophota bacterium]